jgi:hypothetical protein
LFDYKKKLNNLQNKFLIFFILVPIYVNVLNHKIYIWYIFIIGLILWGGLNINEKLKLRNSKILIFFTIIYINFLIKLLSGVVGGSDTYNYFDYSNYISGIYSGIAPIGVGFLIAINIGNKLKEWLKLFTLIVLFHAVYQLVVTISYYFIDNNAIFLMFNVTESSFNEMKVGLKNAQTIRFGGIYINPNIYASIVMLALLSIFYIRAHFNKLTVYLIYLIYLLSITLAYSKSIILTIIPFLIYELRKVNYKTLIILIFVMTMVMAQFWEVIINYFEVRFFDPKAGLFSENLRMEIYILNFLSKRKR